ncbi:hypothetical protein MCEME20_00039 [Candidatus Pelagibacterales bacterium]
MILNERILYLFKKISQIIIKYIQFLIHSILVGIARIAINFHREK